MPLVLPHGRRSYPPRLRARYDGYPISTSLVAPFKKYIGSGSDFYDLDNVQTAQSAVGPVWTNVGGTSFVRAKLAEPLVITSTPYITFVLVFRAIAVNSSTICGLGAETGTAGNTLCVLRPMTADNTKLNFLIQDGSANLLANTNSGGAVTINDGNWHCAVATAKLTSSGAPNAIYIDGKSDGSGTRSASAAATTFSTITAFGFRRGATDAASSGECEIAMFVPIFGYLNAGAAASLSANPWQLLEPTVRRQLFGVTTAATFNAAWNVSANTVIQPGAIAA